MSSKKKEPVNSLAGWAEIIKKQGEDGSIDSFMNKIDQLNNNRKEAAELFHKLWGQAHDSPDYNKQDWIKMQSLLDKLDIPV